MKSSQSGTKVKGANLRISFPHLFHPDTSEIGGGKYNATFMWPKEDTNTTEKMKAGIEAARKIGLEKFGKSFANAECNPIHDGDAYAAEKGEEKAKGFKGCYYIQAKTKFKPQVVDRSLQLLSEEEDVPAGSYVNASFTCFPYNTAGKKGVSIALGNVQMLRCRPEDRIIGSSSATDDFEIEEEEEDEDFGF